VSRIGDIRTGLANNLSAIKGLRVSAFVPEQPNPPIAVVMPPSITFDRAFARGADEYRFTVLVIVGRVDERSSQSTMDAYCDPTGPLSIKTAIEADKSLGGSAYSLRVEEMRNYQALSVGEVQYLSAEFVVQVIAE
jgi:hypothetical protein